MQQNMFLRQFPGKTFDDFFVKVVKFAPVNVYKYNILKSALEKLFHNEDQDELDTLTVRDVLDTLVEGPLKYVKKLKDHDDMYIFNQKVGMLHPEFSSLSPFTYQKTKILMNVFGLINPKNIELLEEFNYLKRKNTIINNWNNSLSNKFNDEKNFLISRIVKDADKSIEKHNNSLYSFDNGLKRWKPSVEWSEEEISMLFLMLQDFVSNTKILGTTYPSYVDHLNGMREILNDNLYKQPNVQPPLNLHVTNRMPSIKECMETLVALFVVGQIDIPILKNYPYAFVPPSVLSEILMKFEDGESDESIKETWNTFLEWQGKNDVILHIGDIKILRGTKENIYIQIYDFLEDGREND